MVCTAVIRLKIWFYQYRGQVYSGTYGLRGSCLMGKWWRSDGTDRKLRHERIVRTHFRFRPIAQERNSDPKGKSTSQGWLVMGTDKCLCNDWLANILGSRVNIDKWIAPLERHQKCGPTDIGDKHILVNIASQYADWWRNDGDQIRKVGSRGPWSCAGISFLFTPNAQERNGKSRVNQRVRDDS